MLRRPTGKPRLHSDVEFTARTRLRAALESLSGLIGSAALIALYARGDWGWPLGFVALVPWLWTLDRLRSMSAVLASAALMSALFVVAALGWFGPAFGAYVGLDPWLATAILLLLAPLLQPQFLIFALVRLLLARRHGAWLRAFAGAAAWVGCEWLFPKLLGDTLGHGLQPTALLRQAADLGGAAGLTFALLLVNEAVARAVPMRRGAWRPLMSALMLVAAWAGYGQWRLSALHEALSEPSPALRIGLVQANLTDLERRRAEQGAYAVVREVLDTHVAMSEHAVREQGAEALLWSETVYPTTFGQPKSADGAAFDREILAAVAAFGTPLVFGTYDRDEYGEFNTAAVVDPARGLLGHYRKTHLFPLTEWVPAWLDGPQIRRLLPWTGTWRPGDGARVFPLTLADGREANVLPLICLDDVRPQLAIDGARLGAQAIVGLSNDSWFTAHPQGARLHLAVATFRSIETRLPQLRATTNGLSAIVDESGEVLVQTGIGQQAVLVGEIPLRDPVPTLMRAWGDWVGPASLAGLAMFLLAAAWRRMQRRFAAIAMTDAVPAGPIEVVLLTPPWQVATLVLRLCAALVLAWLAWRMLTIDGLQVNSLLQVRGFAYGVALPLLIAWTIRHLHRAQAQVRDGMLAFVTPSQRIEMPLSGIARLQLGWHAGPEAALRLVLASGRRWATTIALADPQALSLRLKLAGHEVQWANSASARIAEFAAARAAAHHRWLDHGAIKFVLFPLLPALVAFRLHQHIAFGGTFGELHTFGAAAWLTGLLIWWAAWSLGMMLLAGVMRPFVELAMAAAWISDAVRAGALRRMLESLTRAVYYLGTPAWLLARLLFA